MKLFTRLLTLLILTSFSIKSLAQETTATLSGTVTDAKGAPISGASVTVKHEPTSFKTGTQTNNKGIFVIPNLKVGGPYTINITFVGYEDQKFENVNLTLGNNPHMSVDMKDLDKSLQEVVVSTRARAMGGLTVGRAQLATLPSLGRSLSDFT